ncbi:MAG TPA: type II secretion system protein GspE [Candidatus Omnitrophica bacterium]|nr:type II secretion system protein GspE [Candidatus Omnitrophota bacterium]
MASLKDRIKEILIRDKLIPQEDLQHALDEQKKTGEELNKILIRLKLIDEDTLTHLLSQDLGYPPISISRLKIEPELVKIIPKDIAMKYQIMPISVMGDRLTLAMADPLNIFAIDNIKALTGYTINPIISKTKDIETTIEKYYGRQEAFVTPTETFEAIIKDIKDTGELELVKEAADQSGVEHLGEEAPIIKLTDTIIQQAVLSRASDVFIEPMEKSVRVRYRIDGVIREIDRMTKVLLYPIVSRIKVIAALDISEHRLPQDGRFKTIIGGGREVDFRVNVLPTVLGEKVVLRVLDQGTSVLNIETLGFEPESLKRLRECAVKPHGLILACGPTGSGKTTTLYSILKYVDSPGKNIVTVEDPVEYRLHGIVQVQVHEKAGLTFASALRSILRQDPDVVLIGEIRDRETAQIAVQASLTGHLVLSTLHTNDAANAVTRLVDIGIEPYKIAASLRGVVAQRLMRRLCPSCKEVAVEAIPAKLTKWIPVGTPLYRASGCAECAMTGFRGRFSIVEVLTMTPDVEKVVSSGAPADRIAEAAQAAGMGSLWESGVFHILRGESSIEELMRVVDVPFEGTEAPAEPPPVLAAPGSRSSGTARKSGAVESPRHVDVASEAFELLDNIGKTSKLQHLPAKVLLVDDEDQLRRVMKDILERDGFNVAEARDGIQALDQVDKFGPDVVVLDLNLPGLDGYGVLAHLRSRPATVNVPVIVLTAKGDEDNEVRVFELGADDFLTKPFRARALSARLDAVLNRRRFSA